MNASNSAVIASSARSPSATRAAVLAVGALVAPWLAAWWLPPFAQPQSFHDYADQRAWLAVPHAADVLSNLPFLIIGVFGLHFVLRGSKLGARPAFLDRQAAWPYALLFGGVLLTAFGSAWYHAQPSDATLVWDRLPMALGFAGLVAGTLTDRAPRHVLLLLTAFAAVGAGTVLYWTVYGNLVPYLLMQIGFIGAALIASTWMPSRYTHSKNVYTAAGLYATAIVFDRLDHQVYAALGGLVSGHTLKHLFACAAIWMILSMLRERRLSAARPSEGLSLQAPSPASGRRAARRAVRLNERR